MNNCNNQCNICPNLVISDSVSIVTINNVDTLVIDLPTGTYLNCNKYCIVVAQTIPDEATINMPVAFSIGGVTTTTYPFINCNCTQVTASGVRSRVRYPAVVFTNASGAVIRSTRNICCYPQNNLFSIPATT